MTTAKNQLLSHCKTRRRPWSRSSANFKASFTSSEPLQCWTGFRMRFHKQSATSSEQVLPANSDIKVWMLTGDKMETAENIAKSCNLIQHDFSVLRYECKDKDPQVIHQQLELLIENAQKESEERKVSLLIEGPDLTPIMGIDQL